MLEKIEGQDTAAAWLIGVLAENGVSAETCGWFIGGAAMFYFCVCFGRTSAHDTLGGALTKALDSFVYGATLAGSLALVALGTAYVVREYVILQGVLKGVLSVSPFLLVAFCWRSPRGR